MQVYHTLLFGYSFSKLRGKQTESSALLVDQINRKFDLKELQRLQNINVTRGVHSKQLETLANSKNRKFNILAFLESNRILNDLFGCAIVWMLCLGLMIN